MEGDSKATHCKHFVTRKKRYCRMTVKEGEEYCGEHQSEDPSKNNDDNESQKRIVCPLDPKHVYPQKIVIMETKLGSDSTHTIVDWCSFCQDICEQHLVNNPTQIGGLRDDLLSKTVEIDESKFFYRKCHRGEWHKGDWVFGGIERKSGNCFLVEVPDRTAETLSAVNQSTCYANKLKKHLKKCNAKPAAVVPYMEKNINSGEIDEGDTARTRSLSNVPIQQLLELVSKVNKIHNDTVKDSVVEKMCSYPILEKELSNPEYGNSTRKHLLQTSSILGLLKEYKLLQSDTCYVEFGAGKGKLSYWVSKALENLEYSLSSVLLVERASHRHKYDNKLDKTTGQVIRIRADIANLILSKVEIISKSKHVVGLTKHLCGDATDLALRCLTKCMETGKDIHGLIMAFCCHHRCHWSSYVGKEFFEEAGLTKSDFDVMCGMVSWAVCGSGKSREYRQNCEVILNQNERDKELHLTREQKEEVGKKCKDLLNWGRKMYMQKFGFKSHLCYYVNSEISLENECIISVRENTEI